MIKVHQTLHGYSQGHHLLSATVMPQLSEDMQLMSLMSDWDGFDSKYDASVEYITAYPLNDYYVVAKTWYAYEMARPGCVWTHSLLIEKKDLDSVSDFRLLLQLFRRPQQEKAFDEYGKVLELDNQAGKIEDHQEDDINYASVYFALLTGEKPLVYSVERENGFYQELILRLMNYVPGDILSNMTFSSGSTMPRRIKDRLMSLQFSLNCSGEFDNLKEEKNWNELSVMNFIHHGILQGRTDLRKLLQLFKDDIDGNVDYWIYIINLFVNLSVISHAEETDKSKLYISLLGKIKEFFPSQKDGVKLKLRFTLPELTERLLDNYQFLLEACTNEALTAFTVEQVHLKERFDNLIKGERHEQLVDLLVEINKRGINTEMGFQLYLWATSIIDDADFRRLLDEDYGVLEIMVTMNNQILNRIWWIEAPKEVFEPMFTLFVVRIPEPFDYWVELFDAVFKNEAFVMDTTWHIIWNHVEHPVDRLLNILNQGGAHLVISPAITDECGKHKNEMMTWLKDNRIRNQDIARLYMSCYEAESDEVKNSCAEDWRNFVLDGEYVDTEYYVFLYNLSFCWPKSRLAYKYFKQSFFPLYKLAQTSKLKERHWARIVHNTMFRRIVDWDRCKKMRLMAANRTILAEIDESEILLFTPDAELNMVILKYYKRMKRKR